MSPLLKNLTIVLGITLIAGGAFFLYQQQTSSDIGSESDEVVGVADQEIMQKTDEILADTRKIETLNLDATIFDDRRFKNLKDTRTDVVDVATGRSNPFAPVD